MNFKLILSTCQYWADRTGEKHAAWQAADGTIHYTLIGFPIAGKFVCKAG